MAPKPPSNKKKAKKAQTSPTVVIGGVAAVFVGMLGLLIFDGSETGSRTLVPASQTTVTSRDFACGNDLSTAHFSTATCKPSKCGRRYHPGFLNSKAADDLRGIAEKVFNITGGGAGGPSVYDPHTGAASRGKEFIDLYKALKMQGYPSPISTQEKDLLANTVSSIKKYVENEFGVQGMELTTPTFFSRIRGDLKAQVPNDQYWHPHVDRKQYKTFDFTALVYLSNHGEDFEGGEFEFFDRTNDPKEKKAIGDTLAFEPTKGAIVAFTSGEENVHRLRKVAKGERFALTIAFSCDQKKQIAEADFMGNALFQASMKEQTLKATTEGGAAAEAPEPEEAEEEEDKEAADAPAEDQ